MGPLKLGTTPWDFSTRGAAGIADQAKFAETNGYESFWLPENHFNANALPDPLMLLAAAASRTTHIRLGTTSYLLTLRHPLQAAEQVAVLDQLSNGRVILGIGRGVAPDMLKAFNVAPKDKRKVFAASLARMISAWSGALVPANEAEPEGAMIQLDPLPVQKPHPPLWVAAFGPKALAQAGGMGLPYLASPMESLKTLSENQKLHQQACDDNGVSRPEVVPIMRTLFVSDDTRLLQNVRERLMQQTRMRADDVEETLDDWAIVGDAGYVRDKVSQYHEQLKLTHLVVTRLRIGGIEKHVLQKSVAKAAEIL